MQTNLYHDQYIGEEAANIEAMSKEELFDALADNHEKLGQAVMRNSAEAYQNGHNDGYRLALSDLGWKRYLHFVYGFITACVVAAVVLLVKEAFR